MIKSKIIINPLNYTLTPIQLECFSAEYFGKCLEAVRGDELEIEFDSVASKNQFIEILDKTFKKKP
jgi:hypothetical protein